MEQVSCKICSSISNKIFNCLILKKYNVNYYKCCKCDFIQTQKPFWLAEAYNSAITSLDIGLANRNIGLSITVSAIISFFFVKKNKMIDYGGGYGLFVRLMRDRGFNFFRQDIYCKNIFANSFDIINLPEATNFEILTAFEVFEHLEDPVAELKKLLRYSSSILFSTMLQPQNNNLPLTPQNWWYFAPEMGQHISIYTVNSLKILANKYNLNFYTNNVDIHLFTNKKINQTFFKMVCNYKIAKLILKFTDRGEGLLHTDYKYLQNNLL